MIYRGAPLGQVKHLKYGLLRRFLTRSLFYEVVAFLIGKHNLLSLAMDKASLDETFRVIKKNHPALTVSWLPGLDGFSHRSGAREQGCYIKQMGSLDKQWSNLVAALAQDGGTDDRLIVITADHGQYDCSADDKTQTFRITSEDLYENVHDHQIDENYKKLLPVKMQDGKLKIDRDSRTYSVVFAPNGGMCHVYVAELQVPDGLFWSHRLRWKNDTYVNVLRELCNSFADYRGISLVLARTSEANFQWWDGKTRNWKALSSIDENIFPLCRRRIMPLVGSVRTGDILLVARPGFYFEDKSFKGEHGTLEKPDSNIPLLMISPAFSRRRMDENPLCLPDVGQTVGRIMGFHEELQRSVQRPDDLLEEDVQNLKAESSEEIAALATAQKEFWSVLRKVPNRSDREQLGKVGTKVLEYLGLPFGTQLDITATPREALSLFAASGVSAHSVSRAIEIQREIEEMDINLEPYADIFTQ
jgi:arylsulfatase A-like enzyme